MNESLVSEIEKLQKLSGPDLLVRFRELHGREPRSKNRAWLLRRCCWKVQEVAMGGLSIAAKRRLSSIASEISLPLEDEPRTVTGQLPGSRRNGELSLGSSIEREYRNERVTLRTVEGGYVVEGCSTVDPKIIHRSVSSAAGAVCLGHVNGRVWWGIAGRRKSS